MWAFAAVAALSGGLIALLGDDEHPRLDLLASASAAEVRLVLGARRVLVLDQAVEEDGAFAKQNARAILYFAYPSGAGVL